MFHHARISYSILIGLLAFILIPQNTVRAVDFTINAPTAYAVADGLCSLIEAIDNANADAQTHADCPAGAGADVLTLTAPVVLDGTATFNVNGATGLPSITSDITIDGTAFGIYRAPTAPAFRILAIGGAGNLTLNRITINGGLLNNGFVDGGGIFNTGTLTMTESTVQNNTVAGIFPSGGGIHAVTTAVTTLTNTVIENNVADNGDPARVFDFGGGIYSAGTLRLTNVTVQNNRAAEYGGGIYASGETFIDNSIISGNTAQIGGGLLSFETFTGNAFRISNTVFANNTATGGSNVTGSGGGAIRNGSDNITIFGSTFTGNTAQNDAIGGAIHNTANLNISASIFDSNRTTGGGVGGAIANLQLGEVNLRGSIVRNNTSVANGGGLYTALAPFNVFDSLITGNSTQGSGGGLYEAPSNVDGFTVQRSVISNNFAAFIGGGVANEGNQSTTRIINSTITGNFSPTFGGGVGLNAGGLVELTYTTIAENSSTNFINSVGGLNLFAGTGVLQGNIIANNDNEDCSATNASTSLGFNITTGRVGGIPPDRWCSFIPLDPTDLPETDPLLDALGANGSIGASYTLGAGSPAIDLAPADCPAVLGGVDQRGVPRPAGSCDSGSTSSDNVILPTVYFTTPTTLFDNEETAAGVQTVELVIDNTAGNFNTPTTVPLTVHVAQVGSASNNLDYTSTQPTALTLQFDNVNFPAVGTIETVQFDFAVLDDMIFEGDETLTLALIVTGPGILDATRSTHQITIIDNDAPPAPTTVVDMPTIVDTSATGAFTPTISKLGFLQSTDTLEWVITVTNTGAVTGANVVLTDVIPSGFTVENVTSTRGTVSVNGSTVTVNMGAFASGERAQITITTSVADGVIPITPNTACVMATNANSDTCATALPVSALPTTGETPLWRSVLMGALMLLGGAGVVGGWLWRH